MDVTFRKRKIPLRVYEVRTGKLVAKTSVQIDGRTCPRRLHHTYSGVLDLPPSQVYVTPSKSDIRAAYRSLIKP